MPENPPIDLCDAKQHTIAKRLKKDAREMLRVMDCDAALIPTGGGNYIAIGNLEEIQTALTFSVHRAGHKH
jgi:hypothetical protein